MKYYIISAIVGSVLGAAVVVHGVPRTFVEARRNGYI